MIWLQFQTRVGKDVTEGGKSEQLWKQWLKATTPSVSVKIYYLEEKERSGPEGNWR